jgi:hypothetical protein
MSDPSTDKRFSTMMHQVSMSDDKKSYLKQLSEDNTKRLLYGLEASPLVFLSSFIY